MNEKNIGREPTEMEMNALNKGMTELIRKGGDNALLAMINMMNALNTVYRGQEISVHVRDETVKDLMHMSTSIVDGHLGRNVTPKLLPPPESTSYQDKLPTFTYGDTSGGHQRND